MHTHLAAERSKNVTKTWVLMGTFLASISLIGFLLTQMTGDVSFLYGAVGMSLAMNLLAYWKSASIALGSAGARPATEEAFPELHATIARLANELSIPKPSLYVIEDEAPNAFATGRSPNDAHVAVTTGILKRLNEKELEGVLAHELAHVANRDILVMTVAVVLVGVLSVLANSTLRVSRLGKSGGGKAPLVAVIALVATIVAPLAAKLLQLAVSRKREYLADATGALVTHEPQHLASALEKIAGYSEPMQRASYATAHLFISNPFGSSAAGTFLQGLFSTHPPIHERVRILRSK